MARVRILLADDHTMVRQGLRKVLEERADWEVVAEASDGREAVRLAEQHRPDVAILDIAMPLLNGIEATRQITRRVPQHQTVPRRILPTDRQDFLLRSHLLAADPRDATIDAFHATVDIEFASTSTFARVARWIPDGLLRVGEQALPTFVFLMCPRAP